MHAALEGDLPAVRPIAAILLMLLMAVACEPVRDNAPTGAATVPDRQLERSVTTTGPAPVDPATGSSPTGDPPSPSATPGAGDTQAGWLDPPTGPGRLAAGSDPSVLPAPVLIADRGNNRLVVVDPQGRVRWEFPRPGDLAAGQTFKVPDDAFFTPDGRQIVATQEDDFAVSVIDIADHRIVWRYGTPGHHGHGPNELWNPDDALMFADGDVLIPDIKNCRLIVVAVGTNQPKRVIGTPDRPCRHDPPGTFASPNGAFPLTNGHLLVTEINGDWITEIGLDGTPVRSIHAPGITYPSDTNEIRPGLYLTTDYRDPGTIETFDASGQLRWRYRPTGEKTLNKPSLALPLPSGDVIANDDYNHRVIVVDPVTNTIVWQYGQTQVPGDTPGLLRIPDGMDLLPPYSLLSHVSDPR